MLSITHLLSGYLDEDAIDSAIRDISTLLSPDDLNGFVFMVIKKFNNKSEEWTGRR